MRYFAHIECNNNIAWSLFGMQDWNTALMLAVEINSVPTLLKLLEGGAEPDRQDKVGCVVFVENVHT